jgi:hypothetical protein
LENSVQDQLFRTNPGCQASSTLWSQGWVKLQQTSNLKFRTPKIEPSGNERVGRTMLEVRCWMFCLLLLLSAGAGWSVDFPLRWRWSNPQPHGAHVYDMSYSQSAGLAVQACERGQVFTSSDLDLWLPRDTGLTNDLRAVTFLGQRVIVTGESGLVLYSDDGQHYQVGALIDGPTGDWLEAVTASPSLAVAAGDNGAVYTSTNGATWKRQNSGTNTWFSGAAFGAGNFVVVGQNGVILTSPNGTNWTKRTSGISQWLHRVGFGNGRFTAVGNAGVTVSSTNGGASWFPEFSGATNALNHASSGGQDRLLLGASEVRVQDNGAWSNELAKTNGPPVWTYYSAIGLPGFFLIAGRTGLQSEGYQVLGEPYFWLTPYDSIRNWLWDVIRLPGFYITVGDYGTVMSSGNGVDWTLELVPPAVTNTTLLGIGGNTNLLVAVGDGGSVIYSPQMLTNIVFTNETGTVVTQLVGSVGVVWHAIPKPTTNDLQGVAVLSNSLYVITGSKGTVLTSADGSNWTARVSNTTNLLTSATDWSGGLVAVGDNGTVITSSDGVSWTQRTVNTSNWLYRVRWLNNTLIAAGQNGIIMTSTDGLNWSNRVSGTTQWLNDLAFIGDTWFAFGVGGTVLTSSNLANWVNRGTVTRKALYGAAADSKQLIVVGVEGVILRSQVVPNLTPVSFLGYERVGTNGFSPAYNVFLFGGKPDQQFTLNRVTNLVDTTWTGGTELEIFDGSGTLYFIETITGTNIPPIEYYRTQLSPWPPK